MKRGKNMNTNEMNVNDIVAEVNAESFCECTNKEEKVVKMSRANIVQKKASKGIDKKTVIKFAKIIAFMGAVGICGYLKLMSPVLYIPIELVSLCIGCFKAGECKGKAEAKNA